MLTVGAPVTVENGAFCVHGHVLAEAEGDTIRVSLIGNPLDVPLAQVSAGHKPKPRVGKAMDDLTPPHWSALEHERDAPHHWYEAENMQETMSELLGERDRLQADNDALAELVAMQCDTIAELSKPRRCTHEYPDIHPSRPLPAGGEVKPKAADDAEWFEGLVDYLELYLLHTLGTRRPVSISQVDLRNLVTHILD